MSDQAPAPEKIGLALSGGGLRASFFHIGILAQMAEQGLLRSVEVISTVSGGSIIGALYYIHLKELLDRTADDDIRDQDYIKIIKTIEVDFLKATEKNIRMSVLADFKKNFQMKQSDYSRSDRIAELYNEYLFQSVLPKASYPVKMEELIIRPHDPENIYNNQFDPKEHNSDRKAKVPVLVLNATTLNSGRNWQFTAQTMGEPPTSDADKAIGIDMKPIRLRRATGEDGYKNMVEQQQDFSLGHAVAASACVPGLFEPLAISHLYEDTDEDGVRKEKITPQLVDGGVFDNQGIGSLLNYSCTHYIVSDASGQMGMENQVENDAVSVLFRVSSVLQDRTRTEALQHLIAKKKMQNITFLSLRKGLGVREISWINAQNEIAEKDILTPPSSDDFDVDPRVQEKLSAMRTDLDAFTEVEAYSLMLDGYQMSQQDLAKLENVNQQPKQSWAFNKIAPLMKIPTPEYLKQLKVAESVFTKSLQAFPWLWAPLILVFGAIFVFFREPIWAFIAYGSIPIYLIVSIIALWAINKIIPKLVKMYSVLKFLSNPTVIVFKNFIKALLLLVAAVFIKFYLKFINPMYLAQGRVSNLLKEAAKDN